VTGDRATAGSGTEVTQARLIPVGAHAAVVCSGLIPWVVACGHQRNIQTKIEPSWVLADRNQVLIRPRIHGPNMARLRPP